MKMQTNTKKLIYGIGVSDVTCMENGKVKQSYHTWYDMLGRCYDPKYHVRRPTYIGCSVAPEWIRYSEFEQWFDKYHRDGYQLDKDILVQGNKVYGSETCVFVPAYINTLLIKCDSARGKYRIGVCWDTHAKKFAAQCRVDRERKHLGYFDTELEAHDAYCRFKEHHISRIALQAFKAQEIDLKVFVALLEYEVHADD